MSEIDDRPTEAEPIELFVDDTHEQELWSSDWGDKKGDEKGDASDHASDGVDEGASPHPTRELRRPWPEDKRNSMKERYTDSPELQAEVSRLYEEEGGLGPKTLDAINGPRDKGIRGPGRTQNCGECARAVASTLDGHPRGAAAIDADLPRTRQKGERDYPMDSWSGRQYSESESPLATKAALERDLVKAGDGAHVIVRTEWKTKREQLADMDLEPDPNDTTADARSGHFFNVANVDGRITYIDAQSGKMGDEVGNLYLGQSKRWQWFRAEGKEKE